MSRDQEAKTLEGARQRWGAVRELRGKVDRATKFGIGTPAASHALAEAAHNLPFLLAYGALGYTLEWIAHRDGWRFLGRDLGRLLDEAEMRLPLMDKGTVREGKGRRDDLAHRGKLVPRADCWRFIDAVEAELVGWGVLERGN